MTAHLFTATAMTTSPFINASGPTPDPSCPLDTGSLRILLTVFYSLLFLPGLLGNLLALWVFLRVRSKSNSVRVLLTNVALSDLFLVAGLPFRVWYHGVRGDLWELGATVCHTVGVCFYMNMYISIILLGLISVDRYLKISRGGLRRHHRLLPGLLRRWSTATCALIWVLAFAISLLFLVNAETKEITRCFQYKVLQDAKWKGYVNLMLVIAFWIVYCFMVVSYVKIANKLLRTSKEKPDLPNAPRYARTAKKSFFLLFLFTVCFVPYHMVRVFYIATQITDTSCYWRGVANWANEVALIFSALNSCLDPVMYFLLSSSVRQQVMRLLGNVMRAWEAGVGGSSNSVEQDSRSGRSGAVGNHAAVSSSQP